MRKGGLAMKALSLLIAASLGHTMLSCKASGQSSDREEASRMVFVELFTSQGCDMCPEAERLLGELAARNSRVVPIALHVDYFNNPWKDPFSDKLYSERQAAYNTLYTKPKNAEYGLYYTPMVMVDGLQSVNGRDPEGIQAAVRQAQTRKPQVALKAKLELKDDLRAGDLLITLVPQSPRVHGRELLICAVLRDDLVPTPVESGENANKTLTARFPARSKQYEFIRVEGAKESSRQFSFRLESDWNVENLGVVVFAQDRKSGEVYQSTLVRWCPRHQSDRSPETRAATRP
jgi:hypothetical protein